MPNRPGLAWFVRLATAGLILTGSACAAAPKEIGANDPASPLKLVRAIELPGVKGRIDHLALDPEGKRLFVAEVANGSVDVIDLASGKVAARVGGLDEPQGIAWLAPTKEWVVACGGGTVLFYSAADNRETARIDLGDDADDVRLDPRNGHVVVGYGEGGLAVIDPANHKVISRTTFKGHPEGFELGGGKAWVNDPDQGSVLALDLDAGKLFDSWPTPGHSLNFPMALAHDGKSITIAYRFPAALARIDTASGKTLAVQRACGDSDDLYFVGERVLMVCGAGHVDVVRGEMIEARVETRGGARTGLYDPGMRSLYVALPARGGRPAAIWELRLAGG